MDDCTVSNDTPAAENCICRMIRCTDPSLNNMVFVHSLEKFLPAPMSVVLSFSPAEIDLDAHDHKFTASFFFGARIKQSMTDSRIS